MKCHQFNSVSVNKECKTKKPKPFLVFLPDLLVYLEDPLLRPLWYLHSSLGQSTREITKNKTTISKERRVWLLKTLRLRARRRGS